jgi:hypothetical protein
MLRRHLREHFATDGDHIPELDSGPVFARPDAINAHCRTGLLERWVGDDALGL